MLSSGRKIVGMKYNLDARRYANNVAQPREGFCKDAITDQGIQKNKIL
jgi:hypothetical protein